MPNNYLLVLYKHIIQMENENVGLRGGGGGGGNNRNSGNTYVLRQDWQGDGLHFYFIFDAGVLLVNHVDKDHTITGSY